MVVVSCNHSNKHLLGLAQLGGLLQGWHAHGRHLVLVWLLQALQIVMCYI